MMEDARSLEIDRAFRRSYNKKYYQTHKEQIKASQRKYVAKNAEKQRAYMKKYYEENKQRIKDSKRARRDRLRRETAFGAFLKQQGITQCQAADALRVSQSTVSNWANGIGVPQEGKILAAWPEYRGDCDVHA